MRWQKPGEILWPRAFRGRKTLDSALRTTLNLEPGTRNLPYPRSCQASECEQSRTYGLFLPSDSGRNRTKADFRQNPNRIQLRFADLQPLAPPKATSFLPVESNGSEDRRILECGSLLPLLLLNALVLDSANHRTIPSGQDDPQRTAVDHPLTNLDCQRTAGRQIRLGVELQTSSLEP